MQKLIDDLRFSLSRNATTSSRVDGKFILRIEKRLIASLRREWKKQQQYILDGLGNISAFRQEKNSIKINAIEDEIDRLVNNMPGREDVLARIIVQMTVAMDKGGRSIVKRMALAKYGISWSLQNKAAIDFLNAKKTLELSNYRGNIHATTKTKLIDILVKAAKSGQSYQKTAESIMNQGKAGVFSAARGQLIATREIGVAYEKGNNIPITDFQKENPDRLAEKYWQTVEDDSVTEECKENQKRGWIILAQNFPSGDKHAPRLSNPRCRCFTKYEIR